MLSGYFKDKPKIIIDFDCRPFGDYAEVFTFGMIEAVQCGDESNLFGILECIADDYYGGDCVVESIYAQYETLIIENIGTVRQAIMNETFDEMSDRLLPGGVVSLGKSTMLLFDDLEEE